MKEVLLRASEPQSLRELAEWMAKKNGVSADLVYPTVRTFTKRMLKLGILAKYDGKDEGSEDAILDNIERENRFGDFKLHMKVSRNSKAALFKCSRVGENRIFLIKILIDRDEEESISREYNILKALPPHPNVRRCFETSEVDGIPYVLLDYIDGISLSKMVTELPLKTKVVIAGKMMSAVDHLHRHKILHGDIHTSNFVFGPFDQIHLVDMGMAYFESERNTNHGGVAHYMSPERLPDHNLKFSKKRGDYVSEVFQLGVCLYYLLIGDYPFRGYLLRQLAHAIKHENPAPLKYTAYGELISNEISSVVYKALEKKPADRYQSMSEMLADWNQTVWRTSELPLTGQ